MLFRSLVITYRSPLAVGLLVAVAPPAMLTSLRVTVENMGIDPEAVELGRTREMGVAMVYPQVEATVVGAG